MSRMPGQREQGESLEEIETLVALVIWGIEEAFEGQYLDGNFEIMLGKIVIDEEELWRALWMIT